MIYQRAVRQIVLAIPLALSAQVSVAGGWYEMPRHYATGYVYLYYMNMYGYQKVARGWVHVLNTTNACVWIEKQPTARGAVDGNWSRATHMVCGYHNQSYEWSDTFYLAYDGFAFRMCARVGSRPATCGQKKNILHYQ